MTEVTSVRRWGYQKRLFVQADRSRVSSLSPAKYTRRLFFRPEMKKVKKFSER